MVLPCVTIREWVKTFWETSARCISRGSRKKEQYTKSGELQKTASGSRGSTTNLTLLTRFFVIFLAQYRTSNVKAWSWLSLLYTTNCSRVIRNTIFPDGTTLAHNFCICNYWKTQNFFIQQWMRHTSNWMSV